MGERFRGNSYRTTVVCVDSYAGGALAGRFYHPSCPNGERFSSLSRFFRKMEDMLDGLQFPQAFTAARAFAELPEGREEALADESLRQEGKLATFAVRILFRQNASWQGSVTWLEKNREESFRSVLELILLMDSALEAGQE